MKVLEAGRLFLTGKLKRIVAPTKIVFALTTFTVLVLFLVCWLAERQTRTKGEADG